MHILKRVTLAVLLLPTLLLMGCSSLGDTPVFNEEGVAINGYDAVAYFTQASAVAGSQQFQSNQQGVNWLFSSAENLSKFEQAPTQYMPQYGGYCAYAMSYGFVVDTDPEAFTVIDDKLYLNYSLGVRETWLEDTNLHIKDADSNWQEKLMAEQEKD